MGWGDRQQGAMYSAFQGAAGLGKAARSRLPAKGRGRSHLHLPVAADVAGEGPLDSPEALGVPGAQVSARSRCRWEGRQGRSLCSSRRKETHR